jgi:hypothetical protein
MSLFPKLVNVVHKTAFFQIHKMLPPFEFGALLVTLSFLVLVYPAQGQQEGRNHDCI